MRAYHALIRRLCEADPDALGQMSPEFLGTVAGWLLDHDGYLLEQLNQHVPLAGTLDPARVERAMYTALDAGRTDDFCFLYRVHGAPVDPGRLGVAYQRLARRGNVAGIEDVVKATGVAARLDDVSARRAYEVLVGTGRLAAADYVRQLSGVPVQPSAAAVRSGYTVLLLADRYAGIRELSEFSGLSPRPADEELDAAFDRAAADLNFSGLAGAADLLGCVGRFAAFDTYFAKLLALGRYGQIPALIRLCRDARVDGIDTALLDTMAGSTDPTAVAFVYTHESIAGLPGCAAVRMANARHAYRITVEAGDRASVRAVCVHTGQPLLAADAGQLLGSAMDAGDADWVRFAYERIDPQPAPPADAVQLLLFDLCQADRVGLAHELSRLLRVPYDERAGRWLSHLRDGRFDMAADMGTDVCPLAEMLANLTMRASHEVGGVDGTPAGRPTTESAPDAIG